MAPRHLRPRRLLLPAVLAAVLAVEITGLAIARTLSTDTSAPAPADIAAAQPATGIVDGPAGGVPIGDAPADGSRDTTAPRTPTRPPSAANLGAPAGALRTTPKANRPHTPSAAPTTRRAATTATFRGRNHVWIPGLGVSAGVRWFSCSRSAPPSAGVYRWGCGGRKNVYLLGHAWSTFRALHDAYVRGRLRPGLKVWYADAGGHVHEYSVAWWRVVAPTTAASWAWASLSRPSMTLQTCVGARSQYRLMVRLVQVH